MASLIGSLYVSLTADYSAFQRNMRTAGGIVSSTSAGMRRDMGLTARSVTGLQRSMNTGVRPYALIAAAKSFDTAAQRANLLRGALFATTAAFGGLGAALSANIVSRYLDSFTGLENQIRVVSDNSADLAAQIAEVSNVANRSRSSLSATATLYSRLAKAAPGEGAVTLLRRVETISKALQLGGATAQEAASAAIQFSQAIASNRLGGEELRAVLETPLGLQLAKGLDVTIGKFREMGYAGELTAEKLFGSLDKISGSVERDFAKSIATIDQALVIADNRITAFAGKLDDTYGITKLLTGAIIGFGNNLESIVPTLGLLAIGAGSAFAGRLAGGVVGRRTSAVRDEIASRKENLRLANEELQIARAAQTEARKQADELAKAKTAGPTASADLKSTRQYSRDLAAVQKADAAHLALLQQKADVSQQLATINRTTSAGEVRAAQAIANQQIKINGLYDQAATLKQREKQATTQLTAALGQQSQSTAKLSGVKTAEKEINAIKRERVSLNRSIEREETKLGDTQKRLAAETSESFARAANQRAAVLVRDRQLTDQLAKSTQNRIALEQKLATAGAAVRASGLTELARRQAEVTAALRATDAALTGAVTKVALAERASRGLATAWGLVRNAGASLVGFLGGPWGVAFTVAIGALALFGLRARATAEEIARARSIISEELDLLGKGGKATPEQQSAILSERILAETDRLRDVESRLEGLREEIITNFFSRAIDAFADNTQLSADTARAIQTVKLELESGQLTVAKMIDRMRELGVSGEFLAQLERDFGGMISEAKSAEIVIGAVETRIKALDGQRALITIAVDVVDPYGAFSPVGPGPSGYSAKQDAADRKAYSSGQNAMREQIRLIQARDKLLYDAGQGKNAARNSSTAIAYREQELLEQGLASTREAARALATEELNLEEKTRLAGKSAGGAAKDAQNFANKLDELRASAEGAFLGDIDQKVLDFADNLKNGSAMMRQYIDAVKSGDMSKAPAQLLQVRDALLELGAADLWGQIVDQYGTGIQLTSKFADEQAKLAKLVAAGRITAQQAGVYWADFVSQFAGNEWITDTTDALTDFAETAITDFRNIGDAAEELGKRLLNIALQQFVLKPLENWLKGTLGSLVGGGWSGGGFGAGSGFNPFSLTKFATGILGGSIAGLFHKGTSNVQPGGPSRVVPAGAFNHAPKFHNRNIKGNELAAILKRGEAVLKEGETRDMANVMSGLTRRIGEGGNVYAPVWHVDNRGASVEAVARMEQAMKKMDKNFNKRANGAVETKKTRRVVN